MSSPSDSPLSDADRAVLSARADQFFEALNSGKADDWEPFLAGLTGSARAAVLAELVIIDMGHRWRNGERPMIEDYVRRFPEFGPADRVPAAVILEEHRCRLKAGEPVDLASYRDRFPAQYPAIRAELAEGLSGAGTIMPGSGPPTVPGRQPESVVSVSQQYELVRELGRGMFGEVWLARKNPSGIEKAVKILLQPADRDAAKRELRSLELIKNLRHPYLLATEDFWVAENRLYIVMELADFTLRGRLKQCRQDGHPGIPEDELLGYFQEAAEGLDYLHGKKITHRDVKPDNILVANGHAKVADFGLARQQDQLVASMSFAGTPAYMAPEVWGGEGGPPSDLYGLAASYVELRQGQPALQFGRGADVMFAHLDGLFDFADFIAEPEREVLRKAMTRVPEERHPSCLAFAEDLAAALGRPMARRSGRVSVPGSRALSVPTPQPSEVAPTVLPAPGGTVRTGRPPRKGSAAETVTDPRGTVEEVPVRPARPRPKRRLALAAGATALLLGVVGFGLWLFFGGDSTAVTEPTTPTTNRVTQNGEKENGKKGNGKPPVAGLVVPAGTVAEPNAAEVGVIGGRRAPEWVVADRAGQSVRFRLIVPTGGPVAVQPFYVSQSKVWNALYAEASRAKGLTPRTGPEPGDPDAPAVNVTANDAATFAARVFDGGRLPTPDEWDHAAGLYDPRNLPGPLLGGGDPRVTLKAPAPTRGADKARNQFDLIDMAGNGREWTAAVLPGRGQLVRPVGGPTFGDRDLVILRGRNYTSRTPLTYKMLHDERADPQTQFAGVPSPYTGFRVVLPLP